MNGIDTVLPEPGAKLYPVEVTMSEKVVPFVLPWMASVSVRAPQLAGSIRLTELTGTAEPRSTCSHCGNAPELSQ
ncbi:hypothetical protein GCM10007977_008210 [Dactylosporangium sucinum]|uniref:Uncharacterized protein n=1 Tax=Dactylosporangium sucinum TaxID=1424081 RepID=A0A917T627_9ACTN|nr:hypothetical protein GCM10007977_008210 [Dactylosporangium sucinum]